MHVERAAGLLLALALACARSHAQPEGDEGHETEVVCADESQLGTVTLDPRAAARLGLATAAVERRPVAPVRVLAGTIEPAPGGTTNITAPVAGVLADGPLPLPGQRVTRGEVVLRLRPIVSSDPDVRARARRDVDSARARVVELRARARRTRALADAGAVADRVTEEVRADLRVAEAELRAARAALARVTTRPFTADVVLPLAAPEGGRILRLLAVPGQAVMAGAALVDIVRVDRAWVRVVVYLGDLPAIGSGPARVRALGAPPGDRGRPAQRVDAPPLASAAAAAAEVVYAIDNQDGALLPGQRVAVALPLGENAPALVVPAGAVLYDASGGAWVYQVIATGLYSRRRVEVRDFVGDLAVLARGPAPGTRVVVTGAAELYGAEFGVVE